MATRVRWLGHACLYIESDGQRLLIDPFLTGNPAAAAKADDVAADFILISHGHGDHVGDAVEIGKRTGAKLSSNYDLAEAMKLVLGYPAKQADNDTTGHMGGQLNLLNGDVSVCFVPAFHGSAAVPQGR